MEFLPESNKESDTTPVSLRYATEYHAPVLWKAVVEGLVTDREGTYVDGTLGGGGHTAALLDELDERGKVIGIDQDSDALQAVRARMSSEIESGRLRIVQGNFGNLRHLLTEAGVVPVQGILLDLGLSSHQVDVPERGFSYMEAGALDMRMDPRTGFTAHEVVNRWSEGELRRILREYGEEPRAGRISRVLVENRPFESTAGVADVIRGVVPQKEAVKTLSRVFQAIRIVVNNELEMLEQALEDSLEVLAPGGRMAVISYHSLEDRRVKRFFRYGNLRGEPVHDFYGNLLTPWRDLTRKPITADQEEVEHNSRARSARLRIAERLETEQSD